MLNKHQRDESQRSNTGVLSALPRAGFGVTLVMGVVLASGCASQATQDTEGDVSEQAASAPAAQGENSAPQVSQAQQDKADAMMAKVSSSASSVKTEAPAAAEKSAQEATKTTVTSKPAVQKEAPVTEPKPTTVNIVEQEVVAKPVVTQVAAEKEATPKAETNVPAPTETSAAEKAAAAVASLAAPTQQLKSKGNAFDVTVKDLPISHGIWKIKRGEALMDKDIVIGTPTWEMGKPGYMSQIWVTVMDDKILINSSSDIDVKAGATGVRFDGGELIPFSRIEGNNIGVLDGDWLNTLQASERLDVYMGFFPGRVPRSDTFESGIVLEGIDRIVPTYRNLIR